MSWLQLRIDITRQQAYDVEKALQKMGAASVTLEDNADQPILEPALGSTPLWDNSRITGLFNGDVKTKAISEFIEQKCGQLAQRWEQLEDKDWEREWMNNYHPIQCGDNLWICPSWLEPPEPSAVNIMLDPGLAFGTGTHPTTFLCLKWLAKQSTQNIDVIDYGCGSGILAIAALLMGAQSAIGVDIDPQALMATRENAERNQFSEDRIQVYLPDDSPREPADLVFANILAGPLVELAPTLTQLTKVGGQLCLSGIIETQAEKIIAAYSEHFDFAPINQQDEWIQLSAVRRV